MKEEFKSSLAKAMAIAGGGIIPPGLILSTVFGGWKGFLGAFAGFALASINSLAVIWILGWAMKKPVQLLPSILTGSYFARLLALVGTLYGFTLIGVFNTYAMLGCFLALYIAHTSIEMVLAWKSFKPEDQ